MKQIGDLEVKAFTANREHILSDQFLNLPDCTNAEQTKEENEEAGSAFSRRKHKE